MHDMVFHALEGAWMALAVIACPLLFMLTGSYGRHTSSGFGPGVPGRLAWFLIELPCLTIMAACFYGASTTRVAAILGIAWLVHHALVLPFRMLANVKPMQLSSLVGALVCSITNTYLNGHWLTVAANTATPYGTPYTDLWLREPLLWLGAALFVPGTFVCMQSDAILKRMRRSGVTGTVYRIPSGGLFRLVSCPNLLGEMLCAVGWAMATASVCGWAMALWTAALLLPRAHAHHRWYLRNFADYPRNRRALLPGLF